jgi:hypothetical protein
VHHFQLCLHYCQRTISIFPQGGAIYVEAGASLFVNKNRFEGNLLNRARGDDPKGAAIYLEGKFDPIRLDCLIS